VPTTLESALVLLVLLAPGFIAVRVKNSILPHRPSSAFQEAVEVVILSSFLLPVWTAFGWRLLSARQHLIEVATTLQPLNVGTFALVFALMGVLYVVVSPALGILYAAVQIHQPYAALGHRILRGRFRTSIQPEVWDRLFSRETQTWVRVVFKNGTALQGLVAFAGRSPSSRQLGLVSRADIPQSLVRLNAEGAVVEDLTERAAEGIWLEIGPEVQFVEVFR
jgi:hypothetical protein